MRKILLTLLIILVLLGIGALVFAFWPTNSRPVAVPAGGMADAGLKERGHYLALAADCGACHTKPGEAPFSGGLPLASPVGVIYSSNITPDKETGIGDYSLDDFARAVRHGITPAGATLYPAMPYPSYAIMPDADIAALYAYFTQTVPAVRAENRSAEITWPLSMRWPLSIWRKLYAPDPDQVTFDPARYTDPVIARGAYLVQGPGHCGACHTPRAITLQEVALDERSTDYLSGGPVIDGWVAVNLRGDNADGLGTWSVEDIAATLRGARNPHHAVIGKPMQQVVTDSMQHMTDDDRLAIAAYLKSLQGSGRSKSEFVADIGTTKALAAGREPEVGAEIYLDNCAACHRTNGMGDERVFPRIAGNPTVLADDPASLIRLVLAGSSLPGTQTAPSRLGMPGFDWRLSDTQVAELLTFIRRGWGNRADAVSADQVADVRKTIADERKGEGTAASLAERK